MHEVSPQTRAEAGSSRSRLLKQRQQASRLKAGAVGGEKHAPVISRPAMRVWCSCSKASLASSMRSNSTKEKVFLISQRWRGDEGGAERGWERRFVGGASRRTQCCSPQPRMPLKAAQSSPKALTTRRPNSSKAFSMSRVRMVRGSKPATNSVRLGSALSRRACEARRGDERVRTRGGGDGGGA